MNIQYISDNRGHTTAIQIQIPIGDWQAMKNKYKEFEQAEKDIEAVPDWQIELGKIELQNIGNGTAGLLDWEIAKEQFKF